MELANMIDFSGFTKEKYEEVKKAVLDHKFKASQYADFTLPVIINDQPSADVRIDISITDYGNHEWTFDALLHEKGATEDIFLCGWYESALKDISYENLTSSVIDGFRNEYLSQHPELNKQGNIKETVER